MASEISGLGVMNTVCKSNVVAVGNDPDPTFLYVLVVIRVICCCSQNDQSWCFYALNYITM